MSVFVDTGLFYALQNQRAQHHDRAKRALAAIHTGRYGQPYTSEYVFDEAVTLVRTRRGYAEAKLVGCRILGTGQFPAAFEVLTVAPTDFEEAFDVFERYRDHPLSFTDATTAALMDEHGIDHLLSFDDDFDGIVDRLEPGKL